MIRLIILCIVALTTVPAFAEEFSVYLTRHYEKAHDSKDPSLTDAGIARANSLASWMSDKQVSAIFTTEYNRTRQTVAPFSLKSGLDVQTYNPSKLAEMAEKLKFLKKNVVVAGHSNTTPALLKHLGGPDITIEESQFGDMFVVHFQDDEITFERLVITASHSASQ